MLISSAPWLFERKNEFDIYFVHSTSTTFSASWLTPFYAEYVSLLLLISQWEKHILNILADSKYCIHSAMLCCLFSSCTDEGIKRESIKAAAYKCLTWILSVVKERVVTWKPEATDEFFCRNKPEINKSAQISFEKFFPSHSEVTKTTGLLHLITNGLSGCLVLIISVCVLLKTLKHIKVKTEERKNTSKKCLEQSSDSEQSQKNLLPPSVWELSRKWKWGEIGRRRLFKRTRGCDYLIKELQADFQLSKIAPSLKMSLSDPKVFSFSTQRSVTLFAFSS